MAYKINFETIKIIREIKKNHEKYNYVCILFKTFYLRACLPTLY